MNINIDGVVERKEIWVDPNTDNNLFKLSWELDMYKPYIVAGIECFPGNEWVEFESWDYLPIWETWGWVDDLEIKRAQIKGTIYSHLDREKNLIHQGIKVISLFFLDKVENYRVYNADGSTSLWKYSEIFEEEYKKILAEPKYQKFYSSDEVQKYISSDISKIHDGYFAKDKKWTIKDSTERGNQDDELAYELIMKDKERLLSFETPLRFIFSHSALREWWDNPNVFQICTLVETTDPFTKRQKIGRWLRLPVNQEGERIRDENINILTVVANESYEEFAEKLQKEMEQETWVRFWYVDPLSFSHILTLSENWEWEAIPLWGKKSQELFSHLEEKWYISSKGKISQKLKEDIARESVELPEAYTQLSWEVMQELRKSIKVLPVFNRNDRIEVQINKQVYLSEDFKELWNKIKYKTYYKIDFNIEEFIADCVQDIFRMESIPVSKIIMQWVRLDVNKKWIDASDPYKTKRHELTGFKDDLPDIVRMIEENTGLKRSTIINMLLQSKRLDDFMKNPQKFIEKVIAIINNNKRKRIVNGIKYEKLWDDYYYTMEQLESQEVLSNFKNNTLEVSKSIYTHTVYDSGVEKEFAEKMNNNDDVKLFVKLPDWFKINTPLWSYNPDWAILYEKDGVEKLYFVIETKGSFHEVDLRMKETEKISCAKRHFEALGNEVKYDVVDTFDTFESKI